MIAAQNGQRPWHMPRENTRTRPRRSGPFPQPTRRHSFLSFLSAPSAPLRFLRSGPSDCSATTSPSTSVILAGMLLDALQRNSRERPEVVAIVDDRGETTWGQLDQKARRLAKVLRGKTNRECVGILLPSGAAFVTAFYATLYAGKVAVPLNFLLGERETNHVLADSGVDLVVTVQLILSKVDAGAAVKSSGVQILDLLTLKPTVGAMLRQLLPLPSLNRGPDELAAILYTSGTS